jgi:hypothetical protein
MQSTHSSAAGGGADGGCSGPGTLMTMRLLPLAMEVLPVPADADADADADAAARPLR